MPAFERSEDHYIIYNLFSAAEPGELVTYLEMRAATGKLVTGSFSPIRSVLNRLLQDDGIVFANERLVGYRRLTAEQTVDAADGDRGKLHRHARRNSRRLITADTEFASLDERHRLSYSVGLSLFHAIVASTTRHAARRLEAYVKRTDSRPLPFSETMAAFLGGGK